VRTMLISVDPDNVRVHRWLAKRRASALPVDADRFALPTQTLFAVSRASTHDNDVRPAAAAPHGSMSRWMTGVPGLITHAIESTQAAGRNVPVT